MIKNLKEGFLYARLPVEAVVSRDEKGLIQALICGFNDRLDDFRSHAKNLALFYTPGALPQTGNNAVLVDLISAQGKTFTRSLDIEDSTPADGTSALTAWAAQQLGLQLSELVRVRYGVDLLRLIDADLLSQLAFTIGAVLHRSSLVPEEREAHRRLVETYFPRLKIKGTALSFEAVGRLLGFEDVRLTPLWSRIALHRPEDVGSPDNSADFAHSPEYTPQQHFSAFYDPRETRDGPFYTWRGTVSNGTSATNFYTQVVNGFSPFITVGVLAVQNGSVLHPATGSYALAGGGPFKKAFAEPPGAGIRFNAVVEGAAYNGVEVQVLTSGTQAVLSVTDRLSSIKYRSSYFDIGLAADMDKVEQVFGSRAVRPNKDLQAGTNTADGQALSPFRPWTAGSIASNLVTEDWITHTSGNGTSVVTPRHQALPTDRELDYAELASAGVQVAQAFEAVRPATRHPRRTAVGFVHRDTVRYASYGTRARLFTTTTSTVYSGTFAPLPEGQFSVAVDYGSVATSGALDPVVAGLYHFLGAGFSGSFSSVNGAYRFQTLGTAGVPVEAVWTLLDSETIRPEPTFLDKQSGTTGSLIRPEDELGEAYGEDLVDEVVDEYPWKRDLVGGGETVEVNVYSPSSPDIAVVPVQSECSFLDQSGAEVDILAVHSGSMDRLRFKVQVRPTDERYAPGLTGVGYRGTFRSLSSLSAAQKAHTDFETLFEPGYEVYHVGVVQGVVVADAPKFGGPHHRDGLVGWLPFNEHVEDALEVTDRSAVGGNPWIAGIDFTDRVWSAERGWHLSLRAGAQLVSRAYREISADQTISFWIKAGESASGASTRVLELGPIHFDFDAALSTLYGWVRKLDGTRELIGSTLLDGWTFVYIRKASLQAVYGEGNIEIPVGENTVSAAFAESTPSDALTIQSGTTPFSLHDLRIWNRQKSQADMELVRYHAPKQTAVNYPVAWVSTVNRQDRYGLRVLPNGWITTDVMPAWVRKPELARVLRYDSSGLYTGDARFKEVGIGGGRPVPAQCLLGNAYAGVPGSGLVVTTVPVSGVQAAIPGVNQLWLSDRSSGTYTTIVHGVTPVTGNGSAASAQVTGAATPWPNGMESVNPIRDCVWIKGDDGYVYEVSLDGTGTSTYLKARLPYRARSNAERSISTYGSLFYEQPTGAEVRLTDGTRALSVSNGTVYQATGTAIQPVSPALYMYLNSRVVASAVGAQTVTRWTESGATAQDFGVDASSMPGLVDEVTGTLRYPARATAGVLEFTENGTLTPGRYQLQVTSGNVGRPDLDFSGFQVEIIVNATMISKRLLSNRSGFNVQGTDSFEFDVTSGVVGNYLLTLNWLNPYIDAATGSKRQLVIYHYELRKLAAEAYRVTLATSGSVPVIAPVITGSYAPSVPGGWICQLNSYGTVYDARHEATIYASNDTIQATRPLSATLTGMTCEKVEDILFHGTDVVLPDTEGFLPLGSIGSITIT